MAPSSLQKQCSFLSPGRILLLALLAPKPSASSDVSLHHAFSFRLDCPTSPFLWLFVQSAHTDLSPTNQSLLQAHALYTFSTSLSSPSQPNPLKVMSVFISPLPHVYTPFHHSSLNCYYLIYAPNCSNERSLFANDLLNKKPSQHFHLHTF